jgi:hypothetical protein
MIFFFGSVGLYSEAIKNQPASAIHFVFLKIELSCYNKAANDPRWRTPMSAEFEALISNGTWALCPRLRVDKLSENRLPKIHRSPLITCRLSNI